MFLKFNKQIFIISKKKITTTKNIYLSILINMAGFLKSLDLERAGSFDKMTMASTPGKKCK